MIVNWNEIFTKMAPYYLFNQDEIRFWSVGTSCIRHTRDYRTMLIGWSKIVDQREHFMKLLGNIFQKIRSRREYSTSGKDCDRYLEN